MPREGDLIREEDWLEKYTAKMEDSYKPSRVLEEALVGTTLRIAKERLNDREWASSDDEEDTNTNVKEDGKEAREGSNQDVEMADRENTAESMRVDISTLNTAISADDDRSRELLHPAIRHNLSKIDDLLMALHHSRRACLRSMSEDSETQTDITEMTNQDPSEGEEDEDTQSIPATPSKKQKINRKGRGRPRKYETISGFSLSQTESVIESPSPSKSPKRGRPKKDYPRLVDESDYEYALRVARLRKQPLPPPSSFPGTTEPESPTPTVRSNRSSPRKRRNSEFELKAGSRWNPRDWSEVLGAAAIIGFSEDVIARATQRCADLFGEGMAMRTLGDGLPRAGRVVTYLPDVDPTVEDESPGSSDDGGNEQAEERDEDHDTVQRLDINESEDEGGVSDTSEVVKDGKKQRRPLSDVINEKYRCPVATCLRSKHGFGKKYHLGRHLVGQHGFKKGSVELEDTVLGCKVGGRTVRESKVVENSTGPTASGDEKGARSGSGTRGQGRSGNTPEDLDDSDDLEGGVHIDGFMRLIPAKNGGRGSDFAGRKAKFKSPPKSRSKSKSRSKLKAATQDDEEDDISDLQDPADNLDEGVIDIDDADLEDIQNREVEEPKRRRSTRSAKEIGDRERREMVEQYGVFEHGSGSGSDFEVDEEGNEKEEE